MNRVEAISNRILKSDNFENVAHVCCDWEEFVFEVAEWGVDHIATVDFDDTNSSRGCRVRHIYSIIRLSHQMPHPCSKYANPIFA